MSTIAADVLCECFALLPFPDRVTATHVCTHWRRAALSRPGGLWSNIISTGTRTGVVRQLFERAQHAPVKVEILLTDETFEDAMAAVSDHLFHIRQLCLTSLKLGEGALSMTNIHPVYRSLAFPAPILEELEIACPIDDRSAEDFTIQDDDELELMLMVLNFDRRVPTDLFAGQAPRLRKAAFLNMQLHPDGVPALAGLTRIKYTGSTLPAAQLGAIVSTLPKLKALCIAALYGYELPETLPPVDFRLDELDLNMPQVLTDESVGPLLRYLGHHQIWDLTVYRFSDAGWLDALISPPRRPPHTLHLYRGHSFNCSWNMVDAGGYVSSGRASPAPALFDALLARNIFSELETLVLSVAFLFQDISPLERLTQLSLCFSRSSDLSPYVTIPRGRTIACPALRVLEMCGQESRIPTLNKIAVRAGDLERFFDNVLSFSPRRLPRVVLRNVSLDVSELVQDQSILGALSTSEEPVAVPAVLDPKGRYNRWHLCIDE